MEQASTDDSGKKDEQEKSKEGEEEISEKGKKK